MKTLAGLFILAILVACNNNSSTPEAGTDSLTLKKDTMQYGEMKKYWLVFLLKGPNRTHDSVTAARIQAAHINNIDRLAREEKIIMAGPMGYGKGTDKELRGIFIMDARDSTEAANYINTDSAVITGRLRFEIHPWWAAKGKYTFK